MFSPSEHLFPKMDHIRVFRRRLVSGHNNNLGEAGASAIARLGGGLTALAIGAGNKIGATGAAAIAEQCQRLTALTIGEFNDIGEAGGRAVALASTRPSTHGGKFPVISGNFR